MEVHKMLVLTTAHITEKTADFLQNVGSADITGFVSHPFVYGFVVHWWPEQAEELNPVLPKDLQACIRFAQKHGCDYLMLDSDGEVMPELPEYDW